MTHPTDPKGLSEMIYQRMRSLVGVPLNRSGRAANLAWFSFGHSVPVKTLKGQSNTVGAYSLNVQCGWRLSKGNRILVASRDFYYPSTKWDELGLDLDEFDWDVQGMNRFDEKMETLNPQLRSRMVVEHIEVNRFGGLTITFSEQYALEIFPDNSEDAEYWRFFKRGDDFHLVVTDQGIEEYET